MSHGETAWFISITTLLKVQRLKLSMSSLFVKLAEKKNIEHLIASAAGSGAVVAATVSVVKEKKEEPKEESDGDMVLLPI